MWSRKQTNRKRRSSSSANINKQQRIPVPATRTSLVPPSSSQELINLLIRASLDATNSQAQAHPKALLEEVLASKDDAKKELCYNRASIPLAQASNIIVLQGPCEDLVDAVVSTPPDSPIQESPEESRLARLSVFASQFPVTLFVPTMTPTPGPADAAAPADTNCHT